MQGLLRKKYAELLGDPLGLKSAGGFLYLTFCLLVLTFCLIRGIILIDSKLALTI